MTSWIKNFDKPTPRPLAPIAAGTVAGGYTAGGGTAIDYRNDQTRLPMVFVGVSTSILAEYNTMLDGLTNVAAMTLSAAANRMVFTPRGPRGSIDPTGATTSSFALTTALPGSLGANLAANRGDGVGYRVRVIGLTAGKVEERNIVSNTEGTTPTLYLDAPLTFTPASGDQYEFLSGTVFAAASATWTSYDVLTSTIVARSATSMPTISATYYDTCFAQSEMYVPWDRTPGEGFIDSGATYMGGTLKCVQASAASSTTITASTLSNSWALFADEYRNFQVRIVEDSGTPGSVGQRGRISTHTSGGTPVFTVPTWGTTPSASAKFVIEQDDDKIIVFSPTTTIGTYNITANTWNTTTWAAASNARGYGGQAMPFWGMSRDPLGITKQSMWLVPRGGNSRAMDIFDIAGGATGAWTADIVFHGSGTSASGQWPAATQQTSGQMQCNVFTDEGKYVYFVATGSNNSMVSVFRFNIRERYIEAVTTAMMNVGIAAGSFRYLSIAYDGKTKIASFGWLNNTAKSAGSFTFYEHWYLDLLFGG